MSENVRDLTPQQHQALDLLASGKKLSDIATAMNIDPRTLYRWRQLPAFQQLQHEVLQRRREEIRERFTEVMRLAFVSLERELKKAEDPRWINPTTTALNVIKLMHSVPVLASEVMLPIAPQEPLKLEAPTIDAL